MVTVYRTVKERTQYHHEVNRSKFIGIVEPVQSAEEAAETIRRIRLDHPDATHYVYAYVTGDNGEAKKSSDDGEPSGTGGLPLMELIHHDRMKDVLLCVVRYFGGTKLGAGRLKRAYVHAAIKVLEQSEMLAMTQCTVFDLQCPYEHWNKLRHILDKHQWIPETEKYSEKVRIQVSVPVDQVVDFERIVCDLSASTIDVNRLGEGYRSVPHKQLWTDEG